MAYFCCFIQWIRLSYNLQVISQSWHQVYSWQQALAYYWKTEGICTNCDGVPSKEHCRSPILTFSFVVCYLCLRFMFWKVIIMFQSIWWLLPLFEFWNISWHSSLKRDAKLWLTQVIVSDPERSCSSNKPVGGADNKQTDVVRNKPEKTAYISRRPPPLVSPRDHVKNPEAQ